MRFDAKARENLEAAERLLPDEGGVMDALANAAASRAYYAAYLAVADAAQRRRREFTGRDTDYYRHDTLPDEAVAWRILGDDQGDDLRWLRDLRIKADYYEDQVSLEEASQAFEVATELVDALLAALMREDDAVRGLPDAVLLMAAQAQIEGAVLVTNDRALAAVPGVQVSDWSEIDPRT